MRLNYPINPPIDGKRTKKPPLGQEHGWSTWRLQPLVGDGLLIGTGSAVSTQMALILALGQILADIPEGFATIANFRDKGVGRAKRLLISASFLLPVVGAAVLAYFALRGRSEVSKMAGLVFVAGLYMLAAMEDMMREAHESAEDSRWSALSLLAGFAIFLVISGWL